MASKTSKRRDARDVRALLSLYQYSLEKWYEDKHTPAEICAYQLRLLRLAEARIKLMREAIDYR